MTQIFQLNLPFIKLILKIASQQLQIHLLWLVLDSLENLSLLLQTDANYLSRNQRKKHLHARHKHQKKNILAIIHLLFFLVVS